ncbi:Putative entry exlusion protein 2 (plasmid) [Sodalis praecaptivus]|uniref:Putative entry exlusion protein 2 n=1 Tax=Sodalis praecaptivus TaxID=1239307 RepID=W0I4G4_9GAMM|nr:Exc2 family lipoprotein [Sodalis praecaptivus]AHF79308.1 Putative entry exlusion protein 2 [Sodalis praecaptivus]
MLRPRLLFIFTVSLASSVLCACTQTLTSPERHARHYAYVADHGFDPHYYINKAETARMLIPFFRCFWEMGVQDRETGLSREKALEKVMCFQSEEYLTSIETKEKFAGKWYEPYSNPSRKDRKDFAQAISQTYMDGYEGKK